MFRKKVTLQINRPERPARSFFLHLARAGTSPHHRPMFDSDTLLLNPDEHFMREALRQLTQQVREDDSLH